jgi:two-component system, sensor histidine kinase
MDTDQRNDPEYLELCLKVLVEHGAVVRWQVAAIALVIAVIASQGVAWWVASVWFVVVLVTREWRAASVHKLIVQRTSPVHVRIRRVVWWNGALGLVNGLSALFMFWLPLHLDALLTVVLLLWASAGVATNATLLPAFRAFVYPITGLIAMTWALVGDELHVGAAFLCLLLAGTYERQAKRNKATFFDSFYMRRENLELNERLEQDRRALINAKEAAEAANLAKSRFLASASHDLRQPLQALALNSGMLLKQALAPEARELAEDVASSAHTLRIMLDGLLEVSQLDSAEVTAVIRRVELRKVLDSVVSSFRAAARAKQIALRLDAPTSCVLETDPDMLIRILTNLIDNAVKYTDHGEVAVAVVQGAEAVRIDVRDTGIGIAESDQQRIFDELVQLGNAQRDRSRGYGLGLSIVRRMVNAMGLTMTLKSAPGQGSVFSLTIPCGMSSSDTQTQASEGIASVLRPHLHVMVVDDDPDVIKAYRRLMNEFSCEVTAYMDAEAAGKHVDLTGIDAVVVDFRLPGAVTGLGLVEKFRSRQPTLPAVLCTADRTDDIQQECIRLGIGYLRKPWTPDQLIQVLAQQAPYLKPEEPLYGARSQEQVVG